MIQEPLANLFEKLILPQQNKVNFARYLQPYDIKLVKLLQPSSQQQGTKQFDKYVDDDQMVLLHILQVMSLIIGIS